MEASGPRGEQFSGENIKMPPLTRWLPDGSVVKNAPANAEDAGIGVQSLGGGDGGE